MKFATLFREEERRAQVHRALSAMGVEVMGYINVDALVAHLNAQSFAAVVVEDAEDRIGHWLVTLRSRADDSMALIVTGDGGAAGMSRALLHGADDYVVFDDSAAQLMDRLIARTRVKVRPAQRRWWRLGPYTLDASSSSLVSPVAHVHLSPRELQLARMLADARGELVATEKLCKALCGAVDDAAKKAVKQHAHVLRKKCALAAGALAQRLHVRAVYGKGYRLTL